LKAWEIKRELARARTGREVFELVCDKLQGLMAVNGCLVRLYDEEGAPESEYSSLEGVHPPFMEDMVWNGPQEATANGSDVMDMCMKTGSPFVCELSADSDRPSGQDHPFNVIQCDGRCTAPRLRRAGVRSFACVPIMEADEVCGVLVACAPQEGVFTGERLRFLAEFVEAIGIAFMRTIDFEWARQNVMKAEVIARIARFVLELPDSDQLSEKVLECVLEFWDYARVGLFRLEDREAGRFEYSLLADIGRVEDVALTEERCDFLVGDGIVGECFRSDEMVSRSEIRNPFGEGSDVALGDHGPGPWYDCAIPLKKGDRLLGALYVLSNRPRGLNRQKLNALQDISTHIALALWNVEMLEERRRNKQELEQVNKQLAMIVSNAAVGIAGLSPEGIYTHWSPRCEKMLGYTENEVVGRMRPTSLCGDPYDLQAVLDECLARGQITRERVFIHKDGTPRIIQEMMAPMQDYAGNQVGFTSCLLDITEKKESEDALRRERNRLNMIVDAIDAGVALFDGNRKLKWANSTLCRWFDFDYEKTGISCRDVYGCGEQHRPDCPLQMAFEGNRPVRGVVERTDREGYWRCFLQIVAPFEFGEERFLVLTQDITEQRRQTEHLQIMNSLTRALEGTLDLERVKHLVLTCVTAGHALGFNRAFLFLMDEDGERLEGSMAVGPISGEDAARIWSQVSQSASSLDELLDVAEQSDNDRRLSRMLRSVAVPVDERSSVFVRCLNEGAPLIVRAAEEEHVAGEVVRRLGLEEFVVAPLIARGEPLGVIVADNKFSRAPIGGRQAELLRIFCAQASLAIANAYAYRRISDQVQQLQEAQERVLNAERLASVGRMASHLAHEIRNPLTTIGGFARAIRRSAEPGSITSRNASIIYEETRRLEKVLNNALDFTRPAAPDKHRCNLNDIIKEVVREYKDELEKKGVDFKVALQPRLPDSFLDSGQIKQVLINLLKNAIDAIESSERAQIRIASSFSDSSHVISVSDTGSGMDRKTREKIFAPFFTTKRGGVGIGLAICKKIVDEHGGDISVDSEFGRGATFYVRLPGDGGHAAEDADMSGVQVPQSGNGVE
jgi:hypothetical protein